MLQEYIDPSLRGQLFREKSDLVIDPCIDHQIKLFDNDLRKYQNRLNLADPRDRVHASLISQSWVNDQLLETVRLTNSFKLLHLLRLKGDVKPSQTTLNDTFVRAVAENKFHIATILMMNENDPAHINYQKLAASPQAFNDAYNYILDDYVQDERNQDALLWLLGNQWGRVDDELMNETYRSLRFGTFRHDERIDNDQGFYARTRYTRSRTLRDRQYRNQVQKRQEKQRLIRERKVFFEFVINKNVSSEFKQQLENEIAERRRQEERRRAVRDRFNMPTRDAWEIHQYAGMNVNVPAAVFIDAAAPSASANVIGAEQNANAMVVAPEALDTNQAAEVTPEAAETIHTRTMRLNDAILAHIDTRIPDLRYVIGDIASRLTDLIKSTFPIPTDDNDQCAIRSAQHAQNEATRIIGDVLTNETTPIFGRTLAFLDSLYAQPAERTQVLHTWMEGFLSESVSMHSCNPGAVERVVTGLRGINDPQLDGIFAQAEGPYLANRFLKGTFNIFYDENDRNTTTRLREKARAEKNARTLAEVLVLKNVTATSNSQEIEAMLTQYAMESYASYGVTNPTKRQLDEITATTQIIADDYETNLRPYVLAELERIATEQAQTKARSDSSDMSA